MAAENNHLIPPDPDLHFVLSPVLCHISMTSRRLAYVGNHINHVNDSFERLDFHFYKRLHKSIRLVPSPAQVAMFKFDSILIHVL